jgi:uncharacterized membrane protein
MARAPTKIRLPYPVRIIWIRPRIFSAAVLAAVVFVLLPSSMALATRLLVTWDIGVTAYLILLYWLMARSAVNDIRRHAARLDEGRVVILVLTVVASLASLGAIVAELGTSQGAARTPMQLALATVTIVLSWFFIHSIFALHYAHEFYGERGGKHGGLMFPGENPEPDYWDFVYFAFVIGMTFQVSDVAIAARPIRHVATAHGIVSFFFNAALLALVVNIAASAI